jgi:catechol 2,3-dioxygenase-like lactoylglutathione lyase family enzyme
VLETALQDPGVPRVVFDHIAVGVHRIEDALPFLVGELGGRPAGGGVTRAFRFRQWTYGGGKLEVLDPAGPPDGFLHRFLDRRGPGVHHVTFEVPGLDVACAEAEALGFPVVERDDSDPDWKEAFLHPKGAQSIVVQLVEHATPPPAGPPAPQVLPPSPGDPEAGSLGIELIGLRLAARDAERARSLWCDLLGGVGRAHGRDLEVRWPGSVMRLVVRTVGAAAEEGPFAIELGCLRPAVLPQGRHPVLGTAFEPVDVTELPPPPIEGEATVAVERAAEAAAGGDGDRDDTGDDATYFLDGDALERAGEGGP